MKDVQRALTGDADPEELEAIARDSRAAAELASLSELQALLERDAELERATLRGAFTELDGAAPAEAPSRPRARWLARAGIVAAALLVAFAVQRLAGPRRDAGEPIHLGAGLRLHEPAPSFEAFRWSGEIAADEWFEVSVWDTGADPRRDPPLVRSGRLEASEWHPADPAGLPERIRWRVEVLRAGSIHPRLTAEADAVRVP